MVWRRKRREQQQLPKLQKSSAIATTRTSSQTTRSSSIVTPKPPPAVRRKVPANPRSPHGPDLEDQQRHWNASNDAMDSLDSLILMGKVNRGTTPTKPAPPRTSHGTPETLPYTPSLLLSDDEETAPSVRSRGNATASLSTAMCNNLSASVIQQLWSPVYLSMLESSPAATMQRNESWGKFLLPGSERTVKESLRMHFDVHLSICKRMRPISGPAQHGDDDDDANSHKSSIDLDAVDMSYRDIDQVDALVTDFLQSGNILAALNTFKGLLKRQKTDLQKADTLQKLGLLSLFASTNASKKDADKALTPNVKKCRSEALYYSQQAVRSYRQSDRPLQAAMSTLQVALVLYSHNRIQKALQSWREGIQRCLTAASYDHPFICMSLNNLGVLHCELGDMAAGTRSLQESLELQKTLLGSESLHLDAALVSMAVTMGNIALCCKKQRRYDRAIGLLQEALSLYESISCADTTELQRMVSEHLDRLVVEFETRNHAAVDSMVLPSVMDMSRDSSLSCSSNESDRSERMFGNVDGIPNRRAYAKLNMQMSDNHDFLILGLLQPEATPEQRVRETVLTWFGKRVDNEVDGTAFLAYDKTDLEGPESCVRESIPVDLDGGTVVDAELYLKEIHNQALKHLDRLEIDDAVQVFTTALNSHQRKFGENHHLVGRAWHNIGMVRMFARDYEQAERCFKSAIQVRSASLGADHPDVASSVLKIGLLQMAKGDDASARSTFWSIRDMFLRVLGYRHPQLAKILNNIGVVYYQGKDPANAHRCFQMAYESQKNHLEETSNGNANLNEAAEIAIANTLSNVGFIHATEGEYTEALRAFEDALTSLRKYLVEDDPRIVTLQANVDCVVASGGIHPRRRRNRKHKLSCAAPAAAACNAGDLCVSDVFLCGRPGVSNM